MASRLSRDFFETLPNGEMAPYVQRLVGLVLCTAGKMLFLDMRLTRH